MLSGQARDAASVLCGMMGGVSGQRLSIGIVGWRLSAHGISKNAETKLEDAPLYRKEAEDPLHHVKVLASISDSY